MKIFNSRISKASTLSWYGWFICGLAALFYCYEYLLRIEPNVIMSQLMDYFSITAAGFGMLSSVYYYAYTPLQLMVGSITDYLGTRRTLIGALSLCILGGLIFNNTSHFIIAVLGRFLIGVGSAFAFVGTLNLAAAWLPRKQFALAAGLVSSLGMLGAMNGNIAMSHFLQSGYYDWHFILNIISVVGVGLLFILFLFLKEKPDSPDSMVKINDIQQKTSYFKNITDGLPIILNRHIIFSGIIGCMLFLSLTAFADLWGPNYIQTLTHSDLATATRINSMVYLGWLIGAPISGWISDRVMSRRIPLLLGTLLTLIFFCMILILPISNIYLLASILFCFGLFSSTEVLCFAIGNDLVPLQLNATVISIINSIIMLGGLIIQPFVGFLLDLAWSGQSAHGVRIYSLTDYRLALLIVPIFMILALVLVSFSKESYPKPALPLI